MLVCLYGSFRKFWDKSLILNLVVFMKPFDIAAFKILSFSNYTFCQHLYVVKNISGSIHIQLPAT